MKIRVLLFYSVTKLHVGVVLQQGEAGLCMQGTRCSTQQQQMAAASMVSVNLPGYWVSNLWLQWRQHQVAAAAYVQYTAGRNEQLQSLV